MKKANKWLLNLSVLLLLLGLLAGCGTGNPADETSGTEQPSAPVSETDPAEFAAPAEYTIRFDQNTTPDDVTDDETYTYEVTGWNADGTQSVTEEISILTVPYSENAYLEAAVPAPEREGYYFAGWQTRPNVSQDDLVNGVSPYLWMFGTQSRFGDATTVMYIKDMESLTEDGTATLYARWVEVKDISTTEDLQKMREDLYGAYRLTADITLAEVWTPIGCYFSNYENYETGWWTYAFRGFFDGNGHTISGLVIQGAELDVSRYQQEAAVWHNDGENANGCAAMFNAIAGATIQDVTLEEPIVDVTGDYAVHGDYLYASPVAAFDMASTLTNVIINNPTVSVEVSDEASAIRNSIFISASGLVAGGWSDNLTDCQVNGGTITLDAATTASHGGEIYLGGIMGECYSNMTNCGSSARLALTVADGCESVEDANLNVHVGGLSAASTNTVGCSTTNEISVKVAKPTGAASINVGGLSGSQRYRTASQNTIHSTIVTDCQLDETNGQLNVGSVSGQLDVYYLTQILMYTPVASTGCTENIVETTCNGASLSTAIGLLPELDGTPLGWINKGEYEIAEGYTAPSNIEAVTEKYGAYIPSDYLMDGIIWIMVE